MSVHLLANCIKEEVRTLVLDMAEHHKDRLIDAGAS